MSEKSNVTMRIKDNRLTLRQGGEQISVSGAEMWRMLQTQRRLKDLVACPKLRRIK